MIFHLVMNGTQNLNLFPAKGGVPDHYITYIILSKRNWDYNKHFQIGFGNYVQASQVNDPKNTNHLSTLDGIYLCPSPNLQGRYHIMYLRTGQLITRPKSFEKHIIDILIIAV